MKKSDDHYANAYANFVSKFECAANRIQAKGLKVSTSVAHITTSRRWPHKGMMKVSGPQYTPGHWFVPNKSFQQVPEIHPFEFILDGRFTRTEHVDSDIETLFGFEQYTVSQAFGEGFLNESSYQDIWSNSSKHWSVGAGFHVGRYFLDKYVGIKLEYRIPTILRTRGIIK